MIKIEKLTKQYKNNGDDTRYGVFDIDLEFPQKGLFVIEGKSGCGKTTLLNILGLIDSYDSGSYIYDGNEVKDLSLETIETLRAKDLSFIFQDYRLFEELNIYDNITFNCTNEEKLVKTYIRKTIGSLGLSCSIKKLCKNLSGGEKQRVAIARALLKDPKVILADEPTGNLDSRSSKDVMDILKEQSKERLIIMVSHNHQLAEEYADEIITMSDGHVTNVIHNNKVEKHEMVKVDLPLEKSSLKYSFKNISHVLGHNIKSSIVFCILNTVLLLVSMLTISMFSYNEHSTLYRSMKASGETCSSSLVYENKIDNHYYKYEEGALIAKGSLEFDGYPSYKVETTSPYLNVDNINLYMSNVKNCSYKLIKGNMPQNDHEIIVSDAIYQKAGSSLELNGITYTVTGKYETSYSNLSVADTDFKAYNYLNSYGLIFFGGDSDYISKDTSVKSIDFLSAPQNKSANVIEMFSASSLTAGDLAEGVLPTNRNEVVISKDYLSSLGVTASQILNHSFTFDYYDFTNVSNLIRYSPYLDVDSIKVVGVLKDTITGIKAYSNDESFKKIENTYNIYFYLHSNYRLNITSSKSMKNILQGDYIINSYFFNQVSSFSNIMNVCRYAGLVVTISLLVVIFLLLFKDFKNLFVNSRQAMGIMMTLGIHQKDITLYIAIHYGLIELISLICSSSFLALCINSINTNVIQTTFLFDLIPYPVVAVIIAFVFLLGMAVLLSYLGFRKLKENRVSLWMKNSL